MGSTTRVKVTSSNPPSIAGPVVILSRLQMLSQTVAAALRARGIDADDMMWALGVRTATHDLTEADSVLLLDDLDEREFGLAAHYLVGQSPARFLVLTTRPEGPAWGALLSGGVAAVMSSQSSLDEVAAALTLVRRGKSPTSEAKRSALVREWVDWLAGENDAPPAPPPESDAGAFGGVRPISPRGPSTSEL